MRAVILLSPLDYASTVPTTWRSMKCIMGLKAAIDLRIKFLSVFEDSALVISQIKGEWDTKHPNLILYKEHVLTLLPHFEEVTFEHFPESLLRGWMNQRTAVRLILKR